MNTDVTTQYTVIYRQLAPESEQGKTRYDFSEWEQQGETRADGTAVYLVETARPSLTEPMLDSDPCVVSFTPIKAMYEVAFDEGYDNVDGSLFVPGYPEDTTTQLVDEVHNIYHLRSAYRYVLENALDGDDYVAHYRYLGSEQEQEQPTA